jgi:hypothetical protein
VTPVTAFLLAYALWRLRAVVAFLIGALFLLSWVGNQLP